MLAGFHGNEFQRSVEWSRDSLIPLGVGRLFEAAMTHTDPEMRRRAIILWGHGTAGLPDLISSGHTVAITALSTDGDAEVRRAAFKVLHRISLGRVDRMPVIVSALVDRMDDADPWIRARAFYVALDSAPTSALRARILRTAAAERDPQALEALSRTLSVRYQLHSVETTSFLRSLLDILAPQVSGAHSGLNDAFNGLWRKLRSSPVAGVADLVADHVPTQRALIAIALHGDEHLAVEVIQQLGNTQWGLHHLRTEIQRELVQALSSSNESVRTRAFNLLGRVAPTDPEAHRIYTEALRLRDRGSPQRPCAAPAARTVRQVLWGLLRG